jgi:Ca-activated chloride channel family protein
VGLDENFKKTFDCVGKFFDAKNEKSFQYAMGVIISQALNSTSAQVNLLDSYSKPTETAVNMTFYDMRTGVMKYNYVHTINNRGNPDTIPLDPLSTYKIVVHTIPPVEKDSVELTPGKHTIIGIDAPQGYLSIKANGTNEYKELKYIIRKKGEMQTLLVSDAEKTEKLIVGKYDVEVLSLPRIYLNDIVVSQSKTTTVQIHQPGIANIVLQNLGYGQLFLNEKNSLKLLYNLGENNYKETLTLQPGNYTIVFRPKNAKESIYTITREFKIDSGGSVQVKLF